MKKNNKQILTTLLTVVVSVSLVSAVAYAATIIGNNISVDGTINATSSSASALTIGRQGPTNPALQVDASTASSLTGLKIKVAGTGAGLALSVVETGGTNNALTIDAMGSGTITIGSVSTGAITLTRATTITGALTATGGITGITGNIAFTKEAARTISVADSTTAATAGGALGITGAAGVGAAGGAINITAGAGGTDSDGGAVNIKGGAKNGGGTNGAINIGAANTSAVVITPATTITGATGITGLLSPNGGISLAGVVPGATTAGPLLKAGTSATPITTATANTRFIDLYLENSAATGDNRGIYNRLALTGAGAGGGESLRSYTDLQAVVGTAHGAHISLGMGESTTPVGGVTGLGVAIRATLGLPDAALGSGGTYAAMMPEIYSFGAGSAVSAVTELSVIRAVNGGDATGAGRVDAKAFFLSLQGFTPGAAGSGAMITTGTTGAYAGSIKIKIGATTYYIPIHSSPAQ